VGNFMELGVLQIEDYCSRAYRMVLVSYIFGGWRLFIPVNESHYDVHLRAQVAISLKWTEQSPGTGRAE